MKKFISLIAVVLSVVCISVCGFAETSWGEGTYPDVVVTTNSNNVLGVYATWGKLSLTCPLRNVDLSPYLKDINSGEELMGIQTLLASYPNIDCSINTQIIGIVTVPKNYFRLSLGTSTNFLGHNLPYMSVMVNPWQLKNSDGSSLLLIGFGVGRDFIVHSNRFLFLATAPVGDIIGIVISQLK